MAVSAGDVEYGAVRVAYGDPGYISSRGRVMDDERINAVAPNMPPFIRRWFLERDYGKPDVENQDWDLILADWDYIPLLIEYTENSANLFVKRADTFSALMLLQETGEQEKRLDQEIKRIVLENPDFAREICKGALGVIEALIIKKLLGDEIPQDVPKWIREQIERKM